MSVLVGTPEEPHPWTLTITCPRCGHKGVAQDTFPCCEHVTELRAQLSEAWEAWRALLKRHEADLPPEWERPCLCVDCLLARELLAKAGP